MSTTGRDFEHDIQKSCEKEGVFVWKIPDTFIPLKNINKECYAPKMPSDFIMHHDGTLFFVECKSTIYNYITIEHDDKKRQIASHQINSLTKFSQSDGVKCFLFLQFKRDTEDQMTYAIDINDFNRCLEMTGKKSINAMDVVQYGGEIIEQEKNRVHYNYKIKNVFLQKGGK